MKQMIKRRLSVVAGMVLSVAFVGTGALASDSVKPAKRQPAQSGTGGDIGDRMPEPKVVASLDYRCELDGKTASGKVALDDQWILGKSSCLGFGLNNDVCFRLERHQRIDDIYLALRYVKHLNSPLEQNYISLENSTGTGGSGEYMEQTIKTGPFSSKTLKCWMTNVVWKHAKGRYVPFE